LDYADGAIVQLPGCDPRGHRRGEEGGHTHMTPEAQRLAIAKECGWRMPHGKPFGNPSYHVARIEPDGSWYEGPLPDYLSDLNACHEMEKAVIYPRGFAMVYLTWLQDVCNLLSPAKWDDSSRTLYCSSATAAQRAEAFLRTLGKWEDRTMSRDEKIVPPPAA